MGVRSRLSSSLTQLAKVFGPSEPAAMQAGEVASGMTPARPFSPGEPIGPYDGFNRAPRTHEFVAGYNIAARPRSHERVSFDTLRGLVESYDVAQMCIWHRIDSIRSLDWSLIAAKGHTGDVTDAIPTAMAALAKPDRQTPFSQWIAGWLYDILAYDAGTLYRLRNRAGRAIGLRVVDGTMIAPLLDYWGNSPADPAEAYVQYVQGLPWNWLTRSDLIYEPFRKRSNSPYGTAPLESILLNANTDLRFQAYFLQRFTEGNIPAAFASAPESWTPNQIEQFQEYWDAFIIGDQAAKSQIKWMPGGSSLEWSNEKEFSDHFSLFLMRKTAAAYHVVPADLGFTENVNRSSGESQADVQHRVGDLPLLRHCQGILSSFLQEDLGLPLQFAFDLGEEQADRLQQAQADQIYVQVGAISASDVRELRYGLPEPDGVPVPRFVYTTHSGPIPLSSLYAVAGDVDPSTAAPEPGADLPHTVFGGVEGATPNPPIKTMPLAERMYGPSAMPPAPPPQPAAAPAPVAKDGPPAAPLITVGITTETGITGYDLAGRHRAPDDDEDEQRDQLVKSELTSFRRFRAARRRDGRWRDFEFRTVPPTRGRRLNQAGRLDVRKAAGEVAVAGLAVLATDTGRVLMLQRALDDEDPASGAWEFPGGHIEDGETPDEGAAREWAEETGLALPSGRWADISWTSPDGVYQGFIYVTDSEDYVPIFDREPGANPDDPDGDAVEAIAWWEPAQLPGNPAVRQELLDSIDLVMAALGQPQADDEAACPCGLPVIYDQINGWQHSDGSISHDDGESVSDKMAHVVKAGGGPKAGGQSDDWPGWELDEHTADYWAQRIQAAISGVLTADAAQALARDFLASQPVIKAGQDDDGRTDAALAWLALRGLDFAAPLTSTLTGLYTDGYLVGLTSAHAVVDGGKPQTAGWKPGDTEAARQRVNDLGAGDDLDTVLDGAPAVAREIADTRHRDVARELVKGLLTGATAGAIGNAITDLLGRLGSAVTVALTEVTRASGLGALFGYGQREVEMGRWTTGVGNVCPICIRNAEAGPRRIGASYPSGHASAPAHVRCACAIVPA